MHQLPAAVQRWLAILLPPLALLICCFVMVPRQNKLREVNKEIQANQGQVQEYLQKLEAISTLPADPRIASLPATKQEQSDFLRGLSELCRRTGNRMSSVTSLAAPPAAPPPPPGAPAPAPVAGALPPDVVEIKSTVIFEGSFLTTRSFLRGLQRSQRLISMSDCRLNPGQGGYPVLQTTLTVTRYVDAPSAAPPPPASGGK